MQEAPQIMQRMQAPEIMKRQGGNTVNNGENAGSTNNNGQNAGSTTNNGDDSGSRNYNGDNSGNTITNNNNATVMSRTKYKNAHKKTLYRYNVVNRTYAVACRAGNF